jgi:translin
MSVDSQYIKKLRNDLHEHARMRRDVIKYSGDSLHHAKRAIFSLHRGDAEEAKKKLSDAYKGLNGLHKKYKGKPKFTEEGSYKAALEEYVEARLFFQFIQNGKIGHIKGMSVPTEVYIAGLCDLPGELYRYAVRCAASGDEREVELCEQAASDIIGELIEFDLTKYLRTKFDQAKNALQKLEIVMYELSLRNRS